jgi:DEAD/DEAH box helicase domain-containing protein
MFFQLSRSEISLPPMEYDTNAMWIDTEASVLGEFMPDYSSGVHALSHAIVAVAPLFVPCTPSDLDCDHGHYECTKIMLFDVRAGGAGTSAQLWRHFFKPKGVLEAAIDLLSECPSECDSGRYKGGCPGCIQAVPCINFHEDLCRKSGLQIARRMLGRIKNTRFYQVNAEQIQNKNAQIPVVDLGTPRRKERQKALKNASNLVSARKRNIVVGRPSWPTDNADQRTDVEPCDSVGISNSKAPMSPQGGFLKY